MKLSSAYSMVLLSVLFLSCGSTRDTSADESAGEAVVRTIFVEDFSGLFPEPNWIVSGCHALVDKQTGNPAPSLPLLLGREQTVAETSLVPFSSSRGLQAAADIKAPVATQGSAQFLVSDRAEGFLSAAVTVEAGINVVRYMILGREIAVAVVDDGLFHRYALRIESNGDASWLRDGVVQLTVPNFPQSNLLVGFKGPDQGRGIFFIDNIRVGELE